MELAKAKKIAQELMVALADGYQRCTIAGSIRRQKKHVGDIELLCIPKYDGTVDCLDRSIKKLISREMLDYRLNKLGRKVYGPKNKLLLHVPSGIGVDIFSTTEECWPVSLVVRTGGKATNISIAQAAIAKGYKLKAYGSGFTTPDGEIVCRSERDVFEVVELAYLEPWKRG